jgi:hypothetical protein
VSKYFYLLEKSLVGECRRQYEMGICCLGLKIFSILGYMNVELPHIPVWSYSVLNAV